MKNPNSTLSARSAKPLINVTFWAHFSTRIAETRFFHFWDGKSGILLIFHLWSTFCAKNAPRRKSEPKSEKKRICAFRAPKTCPDAYVLKGLALRAKNEIFRFSCIFAIFRFLGAKADFCVQKWENHPKTANSALFRFFAKTAPKMTKKALATARFRANAGFLRFGAKKTQKCVLERKSAKFRKFPYFRSKSWKMHFWGENLKDP